MLPHLDTGNRLIKRIDKVREEEWRKGRMEKSKSTHSELCGFLQTR